MDEDQQVKLNPASDSCKKMTALVMSLVESPQDYADLALALMIVGDLYGIEISSLNDIIKSGEKNAKIAAAAIIKQYGNAQEG